MMALVDSQSDSLDVSQIKKYILNFRGDEPLDLVDNSNSRGLRNITGRKTHCRGDHDGVHTYTDSHKDISCDFANSGRLRARELGDRARSSQSQLSGTGRLFKNIIQNSLPSTVAESTQQMIHPISQPSTAGLSQGDTQVEPSYVYERYIQKDNHSGGGNAGAGGITPDTYGTTDSGHIDLVHNLNLDLGIGVGGSGNEDQQGDGEDEIDAEDDDDFDELSQEHVELYPESRRFQQPKTPATHGKKRSHNGEIRTPNLPMNPFSNAMERPRGVMALSQIFGATQAASSPLLQRIPSDQVPERPSPNLFNIHDSPKVVGSSSPLTTSEAVLKYIPGEPMATYIPMVKSQEEREKLELMQETSSLDDAGPGSSDDGFSSESSSRAKRLRQKAKREMAIQRSLAGVSAPIRGRRMHDGRKLKRGTSAYNAMIISDDADGRRLDAGLDDEAEDEGLGSRPRQRGRSEQPLEQVSEAHHIAGVQVPSTVSRVVNGHRELRNFQSSPSSYETRRAANSSATPAEGVLLEPVSGHVSHRSSGSTEKIDMAIGGTQTIAVADSQPTLPELETSNYPLPDGQETPAPITIFDPHLVASQSRLDNVSMHTQSARPIDPTLTVVENSSIPQPPQSPSQLYSSSPLVARCQSRAPKGGTNDYNSLLPTSTEISRTATRPKEAPSESASPTAVRDRSLTRNNNQGSVRDNRDDDTVKDKHSVVLHPNTNLHANLSSPPRKEAQSNSIRATMTADRTPQKSQYTKRKVIPETSPAYRSESISPAQAYHVRIPSGVDNENGNDEGRRSQTSLTATIRGNAQAQFRSSPSGRRAEYHFQSLTPKRSTISLTSGPSRTLVEIAAAPSPPDPLGDIDIDLGLFTREDVAFQNTINGSSPTRPAKRRRRGAASTTEESEKQAVTISLPLPLSPSDRLKGNISAARDSSKSMAHPVVGIRKYGKGKPPSKKRMPNTPSNRQGEKPFLEVQDTKSRKPEGAGETPNVRPANDVVAPQANETAGDRAATRARSTGTGMNERSHSDVQASTEQNDTCKGPTPKLDTPITVSGRVLALFRDRKAAYYPATCIREEGIGALRHIVRFDDGTIDTLEKQHLRRLEFHLGDTVKVDLEAFRSRNFVVSGFKNRLELVANSIMPSTSADSTAKESREYPLTDIYGYSTVLLTPKQRVSGIAAESEDNNDCIEIPITSIYITKTIWAHFSDRTHLQLPSNTASATGLHTPTLLSAPTTPSTRTRRLTSSLAPPRASVVHTGSSVKRTGLFKSMAFAVSYLGSDTEKDRVMRLIIQQGGRVLFEGYEELFQLDRLQPLSASEVEIEGDNNSLTLSREAETLGFVCLIADRHSRRAKYIQALALGLPCLSGRWIADCVAKTRILDWEPYLLPSGESSFLDGAVRSRVLLPYPAGSVHFKSTVEGRPRLLNGRSVLLIMGKGKAQESRKAYVFLTYALGAKRVSRVVSLDAARKSLANDPAGWDWVYVDYNEASFEKQLFAKPEAGRKRKRGASEDELIHDSTAGKKVKVVGNEFVIQSLILGRLLEED